MLEQRTLKPRTIFCHDNLPILRGINSNSIDLIYLDPPFNKGKAFHAPIGTTAEGAFFHDIWSPDSVDDAWHNQINDRYPKIYQYLDAVSLIGSRSAKYYLIYMAVRLIEIKRILKDTGSIYLHCDPSASHYLKLIMDAVFGHNNFRNEIIWERDPAGKGAKRVSKQYPKNTEIILFYSKSENWLFKQHYTELSEKQKKTYTQTEDRTGRKFKSVTLGDYSQRSIERMKKEDLIYTSKSGKEYKKYYLDEAKSTIGSVWQDIRGFGTMTNAKQYVGYPTQKPIALLHRIIQSSSNEGDVVLDPFCGCATTCVAAENLEREWVGIDVSAQAYELVKMRLDKEVPPNLLRGEPIFREDIPSRTDIDPKRKITAKDKKILLGRQNGRCNGICSPDTQFDMKHLEIDHIIPPSHGGSSGIDNLQLLCGNCNRIKGDRPMDYLMAKKAQFKSGKN